MVRTKGLWVLVLLALLSACSADPTAGPRPTVPASSAPAPTVAATLAPDLRRLADRFVSYAVGEAASFPHRGSVSLTLGGEPVAPVDVTSALAGRDAWTTCPAGWQGYAAASCPVDFLGPLRAAQVNGASVVQEAAYGEVTCAPGRSGPLPEGRLVVLRPVPEVRDCARDFALVLVADERGRLRAVDLTLSAPQLAHGLSRAAPRLAALEAATAAPGLTTLHASSHGDLDPKNTLSVGHTLMALDWDAAGPRSVPREVASVALDWSADLREFQEVVAAYGRASGVRPPAEPWVLGGWVSAHAGWLVHNATTRPGDPLGREEVRRACDRLLRLHAELGAYVDALRSA